MRTSLLKYTFHVLNSCDLRNEHQHSRLTVFLAKKWLFEKGLLIVFFIKTTGKTIIDPGTTRIPACKGQLVTNFLVPSSGPQENVDGIGK